MKTRSTKAGVAILAFALLLAMAAPAMAANSVTVNAEVDVDPYSIVLENGANLDYGMLGVGEAGFSLFGEWIVVRNDGSMPAQLSVIGTDASNGLGGTWELDRFSTGADQFTWRMGGPWGLANVADDSASTLLFDPAMDFAPGQAVWFDNMLSMPTSTSGYGNYSWSGTIYATAP